jgi:hypothetical protein
MMKTILAIALLCGVGFFTGCESKPATRLVEGAVTYSGKPVEHGMVSFQPSAGKLASTAILPGGRYSVELIPGSYQVAVSAPPKLPEGFKEGDPLPPPDPNALPARFNRKETSGLSATIELGSGPQTIDFNMQ